ncbi:MFS transporter [Pyrenochaeta sp. MPI-SDFR-AT-0127]|nr:MFS transporter [Pyrenochaeta sp. MPI-SDFR-AT-0127]
MDGAHAAAASHREHEMTVREALRSYPWAVLWSLIVSMSIIMEGYDTILIASFYAYPEFQQQFGVYDPATGKHNITGPWQSALGSGGTVGAIIGAFANGYLCHRYGFRYVFLGGMILMITFIFISFFGQTVELQVVGQVMCGLPWGIFATIGPAYASEVCPLAIRPYLTAYVNMCFAIGQLIGAGVLQSLLGRGDEWSYRIPFAIQWLWPPFLIVAAILIPESPWWLVRQGRTDDAVKVVRRLTAGKEKDNAENVVALMVHTNNLEERIKAGSSYLDCLRGSDRRRTEIACVTFLGQITCGAQFAYSATYFFLQAGMAASNAYKLNLGGTALAFCGTIGSWFLMKHFGRRALYISGMLAMLVSLMIIGILDIPRNINKAIWAQAAMCFLWLLSYSLTVGPVGWTIPAEVSSTRLRSQTIVLARNSYYIFQIIATVIEPYFINPGELNWRGKTGFFWAGTTLISLIWAYFRLPETKDRTYDELDVIFDNNIPTRMFKAYEVDSFNHYNDQQVRLKGI